MFSFLSLAKHLFFSPSESAARAKYGQSGLCGSGVRGGNTECSFAHQGWPLHEKKMHQQADQMFVFEGYAAKIKCEFLPGTLSGATQHEQRNYTSCCIRRCCSINLNASAYEAHNYQLWQTALLGTQGLFRFLAASLLRLAQGEEKEKPSTQFSTPVHLDSRAPPSPAKLLNCRNTAEVWDCSNFSILCL